MVNKSSDIQWNVQWKQVTKQKSLSLLLKNYCGFLHIFLTYQNERTSLKSNKLKMVKYGKFTNKYVPNKHTEESENFPVTKHI